MFGGAGYNSEYPVEKLMRDAKIFQVIIIIIRLIISVFLWRLIFHRLNENLCSSYRTGETLFSCHNCLIIISSGHQNVCSAHISIVFYIHVHVKNCGCQKPMNLPEGAVN